MAAVIVSTLIGWGVAAVVPDLMAVLIIDSVLTFVLGSAAYFTSFGIKEKRYGN